MWENRKNTRILKAKSSVKVKGGVGLKTEYILRKELEHVLAALTPENRLVMEVSLHTGLRVSDVLALKTENLKPRFWVKEKKTGKSKMVGLPIRLLEPLRAISGRIYVFPNRNDEKRHRTRQAVWKDVKRAAKAFRIPQNLAPHSVRKIYGVELMQKYGSIEKVRRALNHDNESVTLIYAMADKLVKARGG